MTLSIICRIFALFLVLSFGVLFLSCKNKDIKYDNSYQLERSKSKQKIKQSISAHLLVLESEYKEMLSPIATLRKSEPKIYWFVVSWLKTAYHTPNWNGYYSTDWMKATKQNGIDCSGFARVMLDQIFNKKVRGGSQGILDSYCKPTSQNSLSMGDLVFFRAPYSNDNKIVHVGVFLQNNYFVHATSTKSAAKGFGLSINSLSEENWKKEFATGGRIKIK